MKDTAQAPTNALPAANFAENIRQVHLNRMMEAFEDFKGRANTDSVLDLTAIATGPMKEAHVFQEHAKSQEKSSVMACGVEPAANGRPWSASYPNLQRSPVRQPHRLPFENEEFDWVFCNRAIEHVGRYDEQLALLQEAWRVARKGVFLITPNRKHFIEFNTGLPLLHWLPGNLWNHSLKWFGKQAWGEEGKLNLVDASILDNMAKQLPGSPNAEIGHIRFAVLKAHFFMMLRKENRAAV